MTMATRGGNWFSAQVRTHETKNRDKKGNNATNKKGKKQKGRKEENKELEGLKRSDRGLENGEKA